LKTKRVSEGIGSRRAADAPGPPLSCTRRQTLIWGGSSLLGLYALEEVLARGYDRPLIIMEQAQGMIVADPVLCVGCGRCELACTEFNDGKAAPSLARIKVDRNLNFGPLAPAIWRVGHGNMGDGLIIQDLCRQCPHPVPCANMCPEGAIVVSPGTKARVVDPERCTGCGICLRACPWEMITFDPESRKASKCHLCQGKPKCVAACPSGALRYVSWYDLTGRIPLRRPYHPPLIPERTVGCQECHLPGQGRNVREIGALLRGLWNGGGGGRPAGEIGFKWIDMAGTFLVPLTIGAVFIHALLRKFLRK